MATLEVDSRAEPSSSRSEQGPPQNTDHLAVRTLAPKLNLTFVDLDHHIGSRFSVNTLLKEVQKALPDPMVSPHISVSLSKASTILCHSSHCLDDVDIYL